jgi:hypothetical protein
MNLQHSYSYQGKKQGKNATGKNAKMQTEKSGQREQTTDLQMVLMRLTASILRRQLLPRRVFAQTQHQAGERLIRLFLHSAHQDFEAAGNHPTASLAFRRSLEFGGAR